MAAIGGNGNATFAVVLQRYSAGWMRYVACEVWREKSHSFVPQGGKLDPRGPIRSSFSHVHVVGYAPAVPKYPPTPR
jgi:hypothetical protein